MAATAVGPVQGIAPGLPGGVSAWLSVSAAQVIKADPGVLVQVLCTTAGTAIAFNDATTVGGANAANQIWAGALSAGQVLVLNWPCGTGIVLSAITSATLSIAYS